MYRIDPALTGRLIALSIIGAVTACAIFSMAKLHEGNAARQAHRIEDVMKKAAVQCYALEGAYPPSAEYFSHYGIILDEERFYYRYEQNMIGNYMPEIFVIPR